MPAEKRQVAKPVEWVGSSLSDLRAFPREPRREIGQALYEAQIGGRHPAAKPLSGFGSAGVLETVARRDGNAFRSVYTVRFAGVVYVLHAFQKKSKRGIRTPKHELEVVAGRLKLAAAHHNARYGSLKERG
ncbi:MAG: type II toxin-antitoxin system RelE/ParE family toxin [Propylenella sp.]